MIEASWDKIKDILDAVLELPPEKRSQYLDEHCSDPQVRRSVEVLVESYEESSTFLQKPAIMDHLREEEAWIGRTLGPYKLLDEIGAGGMGVVYKAARADDEYSQHVAIKIVSGVLASKHHLDRFRIERQILANLNHPNIARLLDGGTTPEGLPFLVMEFIEGAPINKYCNEQRLPLRKRLELFLQVCSAVQYAHQNLVVHRDLKPGNILVTADGTPKLLDFGIAKILQPLEEGAGPERTIAALRMMTPEYASPEQLEDRPVTTASDVYSLGVVLYALLTGRWPYVADSEKPNDIVRAVASQTPVRPSVAIGKAGKTTKTAGSGSSSTKVGPTAEFSNEPLARLRKELAGDLDAIILKSLERDTARRYSSVEQFAEDIRHYLDDQPVIARLPTLHYRTAKFVHRNAMAVSVATLVAIASVIAVAWIVSAERTASRERARAEQRFNDVRVLANSLIFDIHDSIQNLPGSTPARKLIVDRAIRYLDELSNDASGDVSLQRELAAAYRKLGQVQGGSGGSNLGDTRGAQESFAKAVKLSEAIVARTSHNLKDLQDLAGSYALTQSSENQHKAMQIRQTLVKAEPSNLQFREDLAHSYWWGGSDLSSQNNFTGALEQYREALKLYQAIVDGDPKNAGYKRGLSYTHKRIGAVLAVQKKFTESLEHYHAALQLDEKLVAENPNDAQIRYDITFTYSDIGYVLRNTGDHQAALASYYKALAIRKELAEADPKDVKVRSGIANTYNYIGLNLRDQGRYEEALSAFRNSLEIREDLATADPGNKSWPVVIAFSRDFVGSCYIGLASKSRNSVSNRLFLWRQAKTLLQQALPVLENAEEHHELVGDDAGEPQRTKLEITKCNSAIAKLEKAVHPASGN